MSLNRFVYYSAVVGGWAAFLAWLLLERLIVHMGTLGETAGEIRFWNVVSATVTAAVVGAAIAAGLNLVAGTSRAQWARQLRSVLPGLAGGGIGGLVGGLVGGLKHTYIKFPQVMGWTIMGLAIGGAQGIYEGSTRKARNGLIGGGIGGLLGGLLFGLIPWLFKLIARSGADMSMSSRATAFVILGVSIGAMIGLAQVVLKEAWLTVVDGFRPGRQLILAQTVTVLGRGDHLPLPLLGYPGRDLEAEHLKITRRPDGRHVIQDNGSRIGTRVNGRLIQGPVILADGDLIKLGTNIVRFNQRRRGDREGPVPQTDRSHGTGGGIAPPPPPPGDVPVRGAAAAPACPPTQRPAPAPQAPFRPPEQPSSQGLPAPETSERPGTPRIPPPPPPPG